MPKRRNKAAKGWGSVSLPAIAPSRDIYRSACRRVRVPVTIRCMSLDQCFTGKEASRHQLESDYP